MSLTATILMNPVRTIANLLRRGTILVSLLAFLLAGLLCVGWVLCVGGDGHVAIESVKTQPHPGSAFAAPPDISAAGSQTCVDLPAVESTSSSPPRPEDLPIAPLFALVCLLWSLASPVRRILGPWTRPRGRDPRLIQHRTVVLLN
ncbi:hypothetical protein [Magnetospirillum fulvum]|uniref:hypothetical protein n=1 Tax=Magnetospirillum fulvum TaxID=1082 RepID=UPI0012DBF924|nr:hypothetical protein [Magnetospirillum fulvum]